MAQAAPRPCRSPSCSALVSGAEGYCDKHKVQQRKQEDQRRGSSTARGYNYRWQKARATFLKRHPLCMCSDCKQAGRVMAATVVDHITPHKGDQDLFWDTSNWQSMSKPCHDKKTANEDGGFGR